MRFKLLGPMAALVLVAGCPSPEDTTDVDDTGTEMQMEGPTVTAQEDLVINVGDRVFFDFDKSDLRPDAIDTLNRQSDWMSANGSVTVAIEGHCDERGTIDYNLALGDRRAAAARNYLTSLGARMDNIKTISFGEERPVCNVSAESCWWRNRRAHFVITGRS